MKGALFVADANRIHDYVFESSRLPQIRGASEIVEEAEKEIENLLQKEGGEVIFRGGGNVVAHFERTDEDFVRNLIESAERVFLRVSRGVLSGTAEYTLLEGRTFPEAYRSLHEKLGVRKGRRESVPDFWTLPFTRRCTSCRVRPASKEKRFKDGETIFLCLPCDEKESRSEREGEKESRSKGGGAGNRKFEEWAKRQGHTLTARRSQNLEELSGEIALLYVDGNGIGKYMGEAETLEDLQKRSKSISESVQESVFGSLWKTFQKELQNQGTWPFDVIIVGGDDVILLCRADRSFDLATQILRGIKERGWGASAGLAIGHSHHPIRNLLRLSESLLGEAKRRGKREGRSTLAHYWLKGGAAVYDGKEAIETTYEWRREDESFLLTLRPFSVEEAEALLEKVKEAKGISMHQLHSWARACSRGPLESLVEVWYNVVRLEKKGPQRLLCDLTREVRKQRGEKEDEHDFWVFQDGKRATFLPDLVELVELSKLK